MGVTQILFYFLTFLAIVCAIMVIASKNPVHSVLYLIGVFFAVSGHYVLLNAQFLAVVNIIVYAGAIMVLFLFVVMLMNLNKESEKKSGKWITMAGVLSAGCLMLVLVVALKGADFKRNILVNEVTDEQAIDAGYKSKKDIPTNVQYITVSRKASTKDGDIGLIKNLGNALFKEYVVPFEISSILFLSAIVGAVVLGRRERKAVIS
jgi:NADH-quinone oxidoreductase subunit J